MIHIDDATLHSAHEALVEQRLLEPLSTDVADVRAWLDGELASLVEGHFHEVIGPGALSAVDRSAWIQKVTHQGHGLHSPHIPYSTPYWLLDAGERVGTLALATSVVGLGLLRVWSLYVRPGRRRRRIASRALRAAYDHVTRTGLLGLRILTSWTWRPAVRFYAHLGLWVHDWKHELTSDLRNDLPPYRIRVDGTGARFSVFKENIWHPVIEAEDRGDRLDWRELDGFDDRDGRFAAARLSAPGTLAVHLALEGWPLIRSDAHWAQRHNWSDLGMPEGLAYKIAVFEAVAREQGFIIKTPRIRGLDYERAWDEARPAEISPTRKAKWLAAEPPTKPAPRHQVTTCSTAARAQLLAESAKKDRHGERARKDRAPKDEREGAARQAQGTDH